MVHGREGTERCPVYVGPRFGVTPCPERVYSTCNCRGIYVH